MTMPFDVASRPKDGFAVLHELVLAAIRLAQLADREPKTLDAVIANLRRQTGAQEVDQMQGALADLLAGVRAVLDGEESPP